MVSLKNELGLVVKTGKAALGSNKTIHALLTGNPQSVVLSSNCPKKSNERIRYYCRIANVQCIVSDESSIEVGSACGRPYPISSLAVLERGDSRILETVKQGEQQD